jgi:ATP-dependent Zn protease
LRLANLFEHERRGSFELENHNGKQDVGFDDVAGVDEARAELT